MRDRTHIVATAILALLGGLVVWTIATEVFPYHSLNHDEGVYLQQAAMLLEGQLSLWPPVEDVFRPWFFIEDGDRLYPKYTPVPAAMFALGELAGGYRLALAGIAAANIALVVAVTREVFDKQTGLLAGGFVLISPLFLVDSSVFLPYAPTTLLNLLFAYGYLRADRTRDRRWAVVAGVAVALAFFARPFTAVLFALPFIGHALWSLYTARMAALEHQGIIAGLGLLGVGTALGYNSLMTGSPTVFPYEAFAPLDGIGFGHREILGHEIEYTPALAFRANREVVELFYTEWFAGGLLGSLLASIGLAKTLRGRPSPRESIIATLFGSIVIGNLYFWGNYNILGDLDSAGDGLIAAFGPYYHFDLLLPTATFAAVGTLWLARLLYDTLDARLAHPYPRTILVVVLLVTAAFAGSVTTTDLTDRLGENMEATRTYETAYEPFSDGTPAQSLVLLPDPYGDWLNHPFQYLRNDPDYDGRTVYALDERPFELADEFPNRDIYRYVYRGGWAPYAGSPDAARLQRVTDVSGDELELRTTVGIPDGAIGATARISTDDGSLYLSNSNVEDSLDLTLLLTSDTLHVEGDVRPVQNETLGVTGRDVVRMTIFVDYGAGGGFAYRFELPVDIEDGTLRALTPRIEHCRIARACGGAAAYIPSEAPDDVFVKSTLRAVEPNRNQSASRILTQ